MSEPGTFPPLERFLRVHGIADYDRLVERAAQEPEWFWAAVMEFHGLHFFKPYERLLDVSNGPSGASAGRPTSPTTASTAPSPTGMRRSPPSSGKVRMAVGAR
ncbi:hypothetical protein E2C06_17945 [Dankookia rubra]|uniref:Acetyl-coenzyme A synthetase N-terminal domain-containing protein n=1 Tax=Dankookia rubra TaxID=1442381 RepID=A0A4R5QDJ5_9PROT|nr:acetyl-coenzyme A synthetase N-terminal domain-containing protein [Dankookia rubra]TDH61252.1 hypothetical protein E2C06_17945 [Dankookia rubra]